jgi:nitrate reductase NapE component
VTALAAPAVTSRSLPAVSGGVDRAIRVSTAVVVLAVAGIAAYISYWHAYAVVREYGETGVTAQLEPATIDGLVYASSMVILYAARHDRPVPGLARWMLALGILASLAVNVAQGWSHGLVGAVVAAWPAVSLVGSYGLLAWIIRTAATGGPDHVPAADHHRPVADQARTGPWPAPGPAADAGPASRYGQVIGLAPATGDNPQFPVSAAAAGPRTKAEVGVLDHPVLAADHPDHAANHADQVPGSPSAAGTSGGEIETDAAAVAAYRASVQDGQPISERKLAEMFGKTSRRWARSRMVEALQSPAPV